MASMKHSKYDRQSHDLQSTCIVDSPTVCEVCATSRRWYRAPAQRGRLGEPSLPTDSTGTDSASRPYRSRLGGAAKPIEPPCSEQKSPRSLSLRWGITRSAMKERVMNGASSLEPSSLASASTME